MAAVLFMGMGAALQGTALSIRAGIEGFPELLFGVIMSMFYAGQDVYAPAADRFRGHGKRRIIRRQLESDSPLRSAGGNH